MDYLWCNHNPCYRYHIDLVLQTIQITKMQFPGSDNFAFSWYFAGLEHCNYQTLKCLSFILIFFPYFSCLSLEMSRVAAEWNCNLMKQWRFLLVSFLGLINYLFQLFMSVHVSQE